MVTALRLFLLLAQAEPAPPPPELPAAPTAVEPQPDPTPASAVGLAAGVAYRLAPAGGDVPPELGFSLTTLLGHRYALVGPLSLGVQASLGYDRHSETVRVSRSLGPEQQVPYDAIRGISVFDFVALQTATLELGRARPWVAAGAGVALGHFTSPEPAYAPGESREVFAVLQGAAGLDFTVTGTADVGLRLEYAHALPAHHFQTSGGARLSVFGNRFAARLGVQYRF